MSEKTHAEIIADMRYKAGVICPWQVNGGTCELCPLGHGTHGKDLWKYCSFHKLAHELEAAHKREVDALKQRCAELNAEVAAKDEVIKRLNDAISEEQRCKMATAEKSSVAGDCAKMREALEKCANWGEQIDCQLGSSDETVYAFRDERCLAHNISECARAALAEPPRNCDVHTADELKVIFKRELVSELPIANEHEKNLITITAMRVIDTLFATTKEGGNDGNE